MTIYWGLFLPGVLLLFFPADWLLSSQTELRSYDCFHRLGGGSQSRPWWWVPALWLDPLRGFGGAYLLRAALATGYTRWDVISKPTYAIVIALITIAAFVQTFTRRGDRGVLLAPIGFVAGVTAALTSWPVAGVGIVTGLLGLFGFRQFYAYFVGGAVAIAVIGFILEVPGIWIVPAAGVFVVPVVAGVLTNSTLELPARGSSPEHESARR